MHLKQMYYICTTMNKNNLYKGCLEALVLQLIANEGPLYGYEITQKAKLLSNNQMTITEGTLYPLLHKLEAEGVLESYVEDFNNRPRKYYKIAQNGDGKVQDNKAQLQEFIQNLQAFLNPKLA